MQKTMRKHAYECHLAKIGIDKLVETYYNMPDG